MGPERDDRNQEFKAQKMVRLKGAAKKTIQKYFEHPTHYLFYGSLALLVIGLFIGLRFQWQLYAIIFVLALAEIFIKFKTTDVP